MKKAQGLPLSVIVIAVIVIIVAVVLIVIFTTGIRGPSQELGSCSLRGGECKASCGAGDAKIERTDCPENKKLCCIPVLNIT